mgnify:CR=1 FL=1
MLVLIELCHRCSIETLCYNHICAKCVKEKDYFMGEIDDY